MLTSLSSSPPISCKHLPLAKANNNGISGETVHEGQSSRAYRARQKMVEHESGAHQLYTTRMQEGQESKSGT